MIRILIAEDQAMIREALKALLERERDLEVVATVDRGSAVAEAARHWHPHVALLDIEMPGIDGLAALTELRLTDPACKVVMLTTYGKPGYFRRAFEAGAKGYLLKDSPPRELAAAVRQVAAGHNVIDRTLAVQALTEGRDPLTEREREVLRACAGGAEVAAAAALLHLSTGTVRNHISVAMQKLGATTRYEAVRIAEQRGWV